MIFFYGLAALIAAVLNTRGHFAAPMWTPILNNIVVIATGGVFIADASARRRRRRRDDDAPAEILRARRRHHARHRRAGGRAAAGAAQGRLPLEVAVGLPRAAACASWPGSAPGCCCYVVVSQVGLIVVFKLAKLAGQQDAAPARSIYNNAFLIFMMAHGIVAVSIITALMPRMSAAAADGPARPTWPTSCRSGTRLAAVILVPVDGRLRGARPAAGRHAVLLGQLHPRAGGRTPAG